MSSQTHTQRLRVDPEYARLLELVLKERAARPRSRIHETEARTKDIMALFAHSVPPTSQEYNVKRSTYSFRSYDNEQINLYRFQPTDQTVENDPAVPLPAVLHFHGGGMFMGSVAENIPSIEATVSHSGVQVFSVDYRLAPQNPHPTPVEDCYAALTWLGRNCGDLGVDSSRIAVMGESAGGGLAAAVAIMARDRVHAPPLAKQILIYPMLDDRSLFGDPRLDEAAILKFDDNRVGWTALLGDAAGGPGVSPYAAPARAGSVVGLPPTYIDVGGLDIFAPEDTQFACRLVNACVEVELHLYPGVPHGFEAIVPGSKVGQQAFLNRIRALRGF